MRIAALMFVLSVGLILLSFGNGPLGIVVGWLGANFFALAVAHLLKIHRLFGKTHQGRLPLWSAILFLPYFAFSEIVWWLAVKLSREPAWNQVTESLTIGRRPFNEAVPDAFANYVDLTTEFQEHRTLRSQTGYVCFPILDGNSPTPYQLLIWINSLKPGKTFVHCAQGHGRTGLFAAAVLLHGGSAASKEQALEMVKSARQGVRLNALQQACLDDFAKLIPRREST